MLLPHRRAFHSTSRAASAHASSLALHLLTSAVAVWLTSTGMKGHAGAKNSAATGRPITIVLAPAREESTLPGLNAMETAPDPVDLDAGASSTVSFPGFGFDMRKVADRAMLLFPFATPGLALDAFGLAPRREVKDRVPAPFERPRAEEPRTAARRPPLVIADAALQSLIDAAWSRRDRWSAFKRVVELTNTYSADEGRLPAVLHAYLQQNGLQPYVDTTIRDPRLWVELALAADHVVFVAFISRYASEHPSTRATTELLFLLDKLAQASLDALVTLLNINPQEDLWWTRTANRSAWDLMVELKRHYTVILKRRGLETATALQAHYNKVRLSILTGILRTTPQGYRASDARFLIGAIYWSEGNRADALQTWRDITIDPGDSYVTAYTGILNAMRGGSSPSEIDAVLRAEHGRWVIFSIERLHQFGYRFDTF